MFIDTQAALEDFVSRAASSDVLAIDTEFLREKTYYPKLCLLQLGTASETAIVDPLVVTDLSPLVPLFTSPSIVKLFHAASQDIEIILHETGVIPAPLFDTQIAAALLGHTQQMGYGALVQAECGVQLKKADSFTDWSRRPLSNSQLRYAADDVVYLPKMYARMKAALEEKGRLHWLDADFAALTDRQRYDADVRKRFLRLKRGSQLSRRQLSAARELAAWREEEAVRRNLPRKWVLTDEQIVETCKREPRSLDDLFMVRGLKDKLSTKNARNVLESVVKGLDEPESNWPMSERAHKCEANVDVQIDLMSALVRLRARENDIAFQTLATHGDLVAMARGHLDETELMKGWRREIVGDELVELLEGRLTLSLEGQSMKVTAD